MSTNNSNTNFLLRVTLCGTDNPTVSRMLSMPSQVTFAELHEAVAAAFGWNAEPCTSWVFKLVSQNLLTVDKPNKLVACFAALWTAPDQGYNVTPAHYGTQFTVGGYMKEPVLGKYWAYDYNISRYPHAIEVIKEIKESADDPAKSIKCVGGYGHITRNTWQFAELRGFEDKVKIGGGSWMGETTTLDLNMGGTQPKSEQRQEIKSEAEAANVVGTQPKSEQRQEIKLEAEAANVVGTRGK